MRALVIRRDDSVVENVILVEVVPPDDDIHRYVADDESAPAAPGWTATADGLVPPATAEAPAVEMPPADILAQIAELQRQLAALAALVPAAS